ncbi:MAG TPA: hypothetical protein VMV74_11625 [Bacteroidales bacterium]|nr:hypothetical protein [Bacteroidales bacterium]
MRIKFYSLTFAIAISGLSITTNAQEQPSVQDSVRKNAAKVFIDCRSCDMSFTRQEIPWVNYVRDVREAEVYVLVTSQRTGSGGDQFTYTFQGMNRFRGMNDTLTFTSNPNETNPEMREKRTNLLKAGLLRYAARTPVINEIMISHNHEMEQEEIVDKWNYWVFELQTSPRFNSEESYQRIQLNNSINISKVTPDIKLEIEADQSYNKQRFIEGDEDTTYIRSSKRLDNLFVKSLGEHWSAGLRWDISSSTSQNYIFNNMFMPSVEYDLFPYSEATHRQLRFLYSLGYQYSHYTDTTIYNKMYEHLFLQQVRVAYQILEKWGSVNLSLVASNYLHDLSKSMVQLNASLRVRIIKGLSLSLNGGAAFINDQMNLAKGELSEADRLLRLKEQATSYSIQGGISITYTFGSIYNNVVNPRFGGGGNNYYD